MALQEGTVLADRYRITRRLGVGGMGEVWAADDTQLGTEVALKIMLPAGTLSREVYARFKREAQVLGRIRSDYVARVLDFFSSKNLGLVLVMELIPGQSLSAMIQSEGRISLEVMTGLGLDIARGLRDMHASKIVHRDMKPGNIVVQARPGERPRAMIIDFGVSRILSDPGEEEITAITRDDRVLGTLEYMAPEQIIGSRTATASSDLYALGAMIYRAVSGRHCFGELAEGKLVAAKLNGDAPALNTGRTDAFAVRFCAMVDRLVRKRPKERFADAQELIAELEQIGELATDRVTAPVITIETTLSGDDEMPTASLSLDSSVAELVQEGEAAAAPSATEPISSNSSLTPAIRPRAPELRPKTSWSSVLLVGAMVSIAAAGGVIVGMRLGARQAVVVSAATPSATPAAIASSAPASVQASAAPSASEAPPLVASASASPSSSVAAAPSASAPVAALVLDAAAQTSALPIARPVVIRKPKPVQSAEPTAAPSAIAPPAASTTVLLPDRP